MTTAPYPACHDAPPRVRTKKIDSTLGASPGAVTVRDPETSYIVISGSTGCQPVASNCVQMGLTEVTSPLTRQVVRAGANPLPSINVGTGVGLIVRDDGSTFRLIRAGMVTMLLGALL